MSKQEKEVDDNSTPINYSPEGTWKDPLINSDQWISQDIPPGVDRRTFMMRGAVVGAAALIMGRNLSAQERAQKSTGTPPQLSAELDVVKKEKGPVMTTLDEFYKVGPGPSSSHTIGPMRITYDFYQRCTKLPGDSLAKATA